MGATRGTASGQALACAVAVCIALVLPLSLAAPAQEPAPPAAAPPSPKAPEPQPAKPSAPDGPTPVAVRLTPQAALLAARPRALEWRLDATCHRVETRASAEPGAGLGPEGVAGRWTVFFFSRAAAPHVGDYALLEVEVDRAGVRSLAESRRSPEALLFDIGVQGWDARACLAAAESSGTAPWRAAEPPPGGRIAAALEGRPAGPLWSFDYHDFGPDGRRQVEALRLRVEAREARPVPRDAPLPRRLHRFLTPREAVDVLAQEVATWRPGEPIDALALEGHGGSASVVDALNGRCEAWSVEARAGTGKTALGIRGEIQEDRTVSLREIELLGRDPLLPAWLDAALLVRLVEEQGGREWRLLHPDWRVRFAIPDAGESKTYPVASVTYAATEAEGALALTLALPTQRVLEVKR